ncbi:MAG: phosphoserine phosphatase SerB [Proteobacteria bacterium]|nr:phosphoserine phosphatase SerB [Pseudomonadota bacterium]
MQFVLTLVASKEAPLANAIVVDARDALNALGAETAKPDWLNPEIACDIGFDQISPDQAEAAARARIGDRPIDVFAQPSPTRRKSLLLADMDSTIISSETLDDLAAHVGLKDKIAAITARGMNGELDFIEALRERVAMLAGLPISALQDTWQDIEMSPGAVTTVKTMAAHGAHCVLVSGGFKFFTSRVRAVAGFHDDLSNEFIFDGDRLAGLVTEPILTKDVKLKTLIEKAAARGLPLVASMAVGDGANDLPMLKAAGLGVAYRGKPSVRAEAPARLDHADLTALLYAQGYRKSDLVG